MSGVTPACTVRVVTVVTPTAKALALTKLSESVGASPLASPTQLTAPAADPTG